MRFLGKGNIVVIINRQFKSQLGDLSTLLQDRYHGSYSVTPGYALSTHVGIKIPYANLYSVPPISCEFMSLAETAKAKQKKLLWQPEPHNAPASFKSSGRSPLACCKSELPPMCFFAMKILGTERCPVIPSRAS